MIEHDRFDNLGGHALRLRAIGVLLLVAVLACGFATAQQPTGQAPPQAQPKAEPAPSTPARPVPQEESKPEQQPGAEPETHITPQQAEELFRSVDDILNFASKATHLPIKQPVKRELASRDSVRAFITRHMEEDQDAQRLQRSAASLKKFGLVPRSFDLRAFLLDVLQDQVAGYYDAKTKTVYLLDWVAPEAQRPVLAHELTHALQDQNFGLERWLKVRSNNGKEQKPDLDDTSYEPEEEQAAREAVSEGQAMAVLVDYMLEPSGKTLADTPMMADIFRQSTAARSIDSPVLGKAPMYLRESLIFSYTYGLGFVQALLTNGGKDLAFAGAFKNPPRDTREIMEPKIYLANQHVPPLYLPRLSPVLKGQYEKYDLGEVGQFDVYILLKQFAGADTAEALAPGWRGGTYLLARRVAPGQHDSNTPPAISDLALIYESRWATQQDSNRFAGAYTAWLPKKYKSVKPAATAAGGPIVVDNNRWQTEEGLVYVEPHGTTVLVMEGFDEITATKLRDVVLARARADVEPGPAMNLGSKIRELMPGYVLRRSSFAETGSESRK